MNSVYDSIREGLTADWCKARTYDKIKAENENLCYALQRAVNILRRSIVNKNDADIVNNVVDDAQRFINESKGDQS